MNPVLDLKDIPLDSQDKKEFPLENPNLNLNIESDAKMLALSENSSKTPELKQKALTVDSQLEAVGDEHKYQLYVFAIFGLQWIFATMLIMGQPFIFKPPIFLCKDPDNPGSTIECTELTGGCDDKVFKLPLPNSVVMQFELYCDREWLIYACGCFFFAGTCVFSLVFAQYAETWGRRTSMFVSYLMGVVSILVATFGGNLWWFIIFYTLSGSGFFAYTTITYVLISETASSKYMQYSTVGLLLIWAFSEMLLPFFSYFVTDWRDFCRYLIALPGFVAILLFKWVYESPRFLVLKKDYKALHVILRKIAEVNGRVFSDSMMINPEDAEDFQRQNETEEHKANSFSFYDLWRFRSLRERSIAVSLLSFVSNFCYYGSMFALPNLDGNFYWNAFFLALSEYVAYVISSPIIRMFARRTSLSITFALTTLFSSLMILYSFMNTDKNCEEEKADCVDSYMETTMAIIVKFVIAVGTTILYVYSNEIYPTAVRSLGLGLTNFAASIGSIMASANEEICNEIGIHPVISFIILSGISLYVLRDMPETKGKPLEDDIEELKINNKLMPGKKTNELQSMALPQKDIDLNINIASASGSGGEVFSDGVSDK